MKILINKKEFDIADDKISEAIEKGNAIKINDNSLILRDNKEEQTLRENLKLDFEKEVLKTINKKLKTNSSSVEDLGNVLENLIQEKENNDPNEEFSKLQNELELNKKTIENLIQEKDSLFKNFKSFKNDVTLKEKLNSLFPNNINLPKEDMQLIIKSRLNIDYDENDNIVIKDKDGNVVKNNINNTPIAIDEAIGNFFKENSNVYLKEEQPAGVGNTPTGTGTQKKTLDDILKFAKENNIPHNSKEFFELTTTSIN